MSVVSISIDTNITTAWKNIALGYMCYSVSIGEKNQNLWDFYHQSIESDLQKKLDETELVAMPNIENTRKAFKAFGMDTGKHRVSSEALYRRVRQAKPLYQINSLVDVNNVVSLITGFSLGSYDTKNIEKKILFRLGNEREEYEGIGKSSIHLKNIPILSDKNGAFGSPVSDSIRGMITPTTERGLTVIYSFSGKETLQETLALTKKLFTEYASITDIFSYVV